MISFTIIVPFYNREAYLLRTLRSIVAQTVRPFQLVLVDNGSTDGSAELCKNFMKQLDKDKGIDASLLFEPLKGAARARNRGLAEAKGDWVHFFDSDDEMSSDFLEDVSKEIESSSSTCDIVAAATRMVFENGKEKTRKVFHTTAVTDQILTGMLATQGLVVRTELLRDIDGWNASIPIWNDWELGIRLLMTKPRLRWIKGKSYHRIYQHAESITGESFSSRYDGLKKALVAAQQDIAQLTLPERQYAHTALQARISILSGYLRREGDVGKSRDLLMIMEKSSHFSRIFYSFLRNYAASGMPGAWWLARAILHHIKL